MWIQRREWKVNWIERKKEGRIEKVQEERKKERKEEGRIEKKRIKDERRKELKSV